MKKLLSVFLAVIMVFMVSVTAFAVERPEFPQPTPGVVTFVAESVYVKAGETYEIPVYIVSDYSALDSEIEQGLVESVKFELVASLSGSAAASAEITSEAAITVDGTADLLHQTKQQVATVTVSVSEDFEGGEALISLDLTALGGVATTADGLPVGVIAASDCTTVSGALYEHPHWTKVLHDWVTDIELTIVNFFLLIFQLLGGLIRG